MTTYPIPLTEPLLLRITEVASLTALSRSTVYDLINQGQLQTVRIGRAVRVPSESLRHWVQEQTEKQAES